MRTFRNRQSRGPLIPQDVKADRSIRIDIGMVYPCREADLGRFERVVRGERDREEKNAPCIW